MNFEVEDLVQLERDGVFKDGEVVKVETSTKSKKWPDNYYQLSDEERGDYHNQITVKWNDGTESVESELFLDKQDDEYQREFRIANNEAKELIYKYLAEAEEALAKAVEVSDKYGVPFYSGISFLSQSYRPPSVSEKFPNVDSDFISELADAYSEYGYDGWEHSAVC